MDYREIRKRAKTSVKKNYILFLVLTLLLVFIGSEGSVTGELLRYRSTGEEAVSLAGAVGNGNALNSVEKIIEGTGLFSGSGIPEWIGGFESSLPGKLVHSVMSAGLSSIISGFTVTRFVQSILGLFTASGFSTRILIVFAFLIYGMFWFLLVNVLPVSYYRVQLECRTYSHITASDMLFHIRVRRWIKTAKIMFRVRLYQILWNLTIAGGFIKHYSYLLVPYIAAENPDISASDAILLSRRMMDGHKAEALRLELSFIGWIVLGILTFGISELMWSKPYYHAAIAEFYADIRGKAICDEQTHSILHDDYLYEAPSRESISAAYGDVLDEEAYLRENEPGLQGLQKFFAEYLGIWIGDVEKKKEYQEYQARRIRINEIIEEAKGLKYPLRLNPLYSGDSITKHHSGSDGYLWVRCYSISSLIMMFFMFSMIGWLWEVSLHLIEQHMFVNRGFLHGPWLPIYGAGGVVMTVLLCKLRERPALEFSSAVIVAGFVEYCIARSLELGTHHARYWDYHGMLLNLDGRICALSLTTFGVMGLLIVYLVSPNIDAKLSRIPQKICTLLIVMLIAIFAADAVSSEMNPNQGNGVAVDITQGAWPTTFHHPDHLSINGIEVYSREEAIRAEDSRNAS